MLAAAIAPRFLKGAGRVWKPTKELWMPNPDYANAEYRVKFLCDLKVGIIDEPEKYLVPVIYQRTTEIIEPNREQFKIIYDLV